MTSEAKDRELTPEEAQAGQLYFMVDKIGLTADVVVALLAARAVRHGGDPGAVALTLSGAAEVGATDDTAQVLAERAETTAAGMAEFDRDVRATARRLMTGGAGGEVH